jgi:hypothetical protein
MADWTIVIAGSGDAASAADKCAALVRQLESSGQHIAHGTCTTGDRRSVVHVTPRLTPVHSQA